MILDFTHTSFFNPLGMTTWVWFAGEGVAPVMGAPHVVASTVYHPGVKAAGVFHPGVQESSVYHPGVKASKVVGH